MGNSQSGPGLEVSDLKYLYQPVELVDIQDDHLIVTSAAGTHRINCDARHQLRSGSFGRGAEEFGYKDQQNVDAHPDRVVGRGHGEPNSNPKPRGDIGLDKIISILSEIKKSASPDELIALQRALMPSTTDIVDPMAEDSNVAKKKSSKTEALIRRRSCLTPGLATRESPQAASPTTKPDSQTWSTDMFGQSPLSKLAGWESSNNGLTERAVTPVISQLGIHELGSLRVTNGAVSPAPSVVKGPRENPYFKSSKHDEEYYTASETSGRDSPEKSSTQSATSPSLSSPVKDGDATPTQVRSPGADAWASALEFPVLTGVPSVSSDSRPSTQGSYNEGVASKGNSFLERAASVLRPYQNEASSNPFLVEAADELDPAEPEDLVKAPSPQRVDSFQLYQTEADSNPFLPLSRYRDFLRDDQSSSSSEDMEVEGQEPGPPLSHDEDTYDERSEEPVSDQWEHPLEPRQRSSFRSDAYSRLNGNNLSAEEARSTASSIYSAGSRKENGKARIRPMTDSGYHSQSSLRTLNELEATQEVYHSAANAPGEDHSSLNGEYGSESETGKLVQGDLGSTGTIRKSRPASISGVIREPGDPYATLREPILPRLMHSEMPSTRPKPGGNFLSQGAIVDKALPPPPPTRPPPAPPTEKETPPAERSMLAKFLSSPLTSPMKKGDDQRQGPRKLQKKKRQGAGRRKSEPVIVQSQSGWKSRSTEFPDIPTELSGRYAQRMTEQPDMNHLERTFKSVAHSGSRESISSFQPFNASNIRFPSPTRSPDRKTSRENGRGMRRVSLDFFRSRSLTREDKSSSTGLNGQQQQTLSDFGTVASTIGSSPYDLASSAGGETPRRKSVQDLRDMTHPYQMSSALRRPKSVIGMSDEEASAFAARRSRDRLENFERMRQELSQADADGAAPGRPSHPGRSHSYYVAPPGDPPSKVTRPRGKSVHGSTVESSRQDEMLQKSRRTSEGERAFRVSGDRSGDRSVNQRILTKPRPENGNHNWEHSAQAWRVHRKSIGENLAQGAYDDADAGERRDRRGRPQTPHARSAPQTPAKDRHYERWDLPIHSQRPKPHPAQASPATRSLHKRPGMHVDMQARASSPTPSVLERAAAFERGIGAYTDRGRDNPTGRERSPRKSPRNTGTSPYEQDSRSARYLSRVPASASPSGVASAYTMSQPPPHSAALPPQKLFAPRKRPLPSATYRPAVPTVGPH